MEGELAVCCSDAELELVVFAGSHSGSKWNSSRVSAPNFRIVGMTLSLINNSKLYFRSPPSKNIVI